MDSSPDLSPFLLDLDLDLDLGPKDSDLDLDLKAMDLDLDSDLEVLPASPFSSPLYLRLEDTRTSF